MFSQLVRRSGMTTHLSRMLQKERLENAAAQEEAVTLVEIAKIANLRLQDLIEIPAMEAVRS